jgi:multiple sugar transport system ATP-binding protein
MASGICVNSVGIAAGHCGVHHYAETNDKGICRRNERVVENMAGIVIENVSKIFPGGTKAVNDLCLEIEDGEFIVLVGPSGCGKTTALRMIAGLEEISSGTISIADQVVNDVDPGERDIAMVFQNYALYPHMTVFDNIAFPLRARKLSKNEILERVNKVAALLGLREYLLRKPRTLSGGQRQRVAMGRALVREPQAFLMDEPLSNLDAKLRVQMRTEISALQEQMGITTVYVTHDQVEAMTMGTKIAVMRRGVLQQYGSPQDVYKAPINIFVAAFIGSPAMNFVKGVVRRQQQVEGRYRLSLCGESLDIPGNHLEGTGIAKCVDRKVVMGVRPEHLQIAGDEGSSFEARVTHLELLGSEQLVYVSAAAEPALADEVLEAMELDPLVVAELEKERKDCVANLVVKLDSEVPVSVGESIKLAVRSGCMRFFEMLGGKAITK